MAVVPTWIYRITHIDNLPGIIKRGGVYAPNTTPNDGLTYKPIHHQRIQVQRAATVVPCGPGGVIHDYIPFYFAPRSPMLYAIHKGAVHDYDEGQEPVIYLVSDAQAVASSGAAFVFTDGHAIMALSDFFDSLSHLDKIDWSVMRSQWWNDTDRAPDRKRKRQAEFLVHRFLPWSLIGGIGVMTDQAKSRVETILAGFPRLPSPIVRVKHAWYY